MIMRFINYVKRLFVKDVQVLQPRELLNFEDKERIAELAKGLMLDPLLIAVFETIAAKHRMDWETSRPDEKDRQQTAHLSLMALHNVQLELQRHIIAARMSPATGKYQDKVALKAQARR